MTEGCDFPEEPAHARVYFPSFEGRMGYRQGKCGRTDASPGVKPGTIAMHNKILIFVNEKPIR